LALSLLNIDIASRLHQAGALLSSRQLLESLALQLVVIAAMLLLAWGIRLLTRRWTQELAAPVLRRAPTWRFVEALHRYLPIFYAWLLLAVAAQAGREFGLAFRLVDISAALSALWLVLRLSTAVLRDAAVARAIATLAVIVFGLNILGLLKPTESALDSLAITIGSLRLSVLLVARAAIIVAILVWAATALSHFISVRLRQVSGLSPSIQILTGNLVKIALISIAVLIGLNTVGINLTAFTVFSGAIGVGVGFGLQKIVSNFVSGIILLMERSLKPGDVIEIGNTFGEVTSVNARYTAVRGRDGKEYLIPNENLITNEVINWSYSNQLVRIDVEFGVAYSSDLRQVRALAVSAAQQTARVLPAPVPVCHVKGFGDSAVNFVLRFWIADPADGVTNIKGEVMLNLWDALQAHSVGMPFPQREVHLRDAASEFTARMVPSR
jgi:small-conductance mechanosensitive channel